MRNMYEIQTEYIARQARLSAAYSETKKDNTRLEKLSRIPGYLAAMNPAYEIYNSSCGGMTLEQQIELGCSDWCVEGISGHCYYGHTKKAAEINAAQYMYR